MTNDGFYSCECSNLLKEEEMATGICEECWRKKTIDHSESLNSSFGIPQAVMARKEPRQPEGNRVRSLSCNSYTMQDGAIVGTGHAIPGVDVLSKEHDYSIVCSSAPNTVAPGI